VSADGDTVEEACKNTLERVKDLIRRYNVNGEAYGVKDLDCPFHEEPYMHLSRARESEYVE
jgi:hypothetical protein